MLLGQEQLGLRTENYSGINSIQLNPSNNLTTPFHWDVNLIGGAQFVDNNFGFFRESSIFDLLNDRNEFILATDYGSEEEFPAGAVVFDFAAKGKNKFASAGTKIIGPGVLLNFEKHSFGLFTNFRAVLEGHKIPAVLGYYDYESIPIQGDYNVFPSEIAGMAWSEIGLNYLYKKEIASGQVGIGLNVKYLQGYESVFVKNQNNLDITKLPLDVLSFNNGAAIDFGFTTSSVDEESVDLQQSGKGFGADIGVTYASSEYINGYGFKIGAAILDIGKIKFDQNTEFHQIDINAPFNFNPRNLEDVTDFRDGLNQLNEELFSDSTNTLSGNQYEMWLPSGLSLQADIALKENIFVNATLIHRLALGEIGVRRGNLFAVTPRYESRWVSAFLPISIYDYQHVKVGTAIRLAFLTIGSEDLLSLFGKRKLNGSDFYIALKINPFKIGQNRKRGKEVKCYQF
jgi:hypothetical protein